MTAFTYQGRLTDSGSPANGSYDMQFKLFDTASVGTGAQQGSTQVVNPVAASSGVFTVDLDFGASVFSGANRFLEIGVRPTGSANAYSILAARQPVLASPYAISTINSQQLGGLPASRYLASAGNGNYGIGVANPTSRLEIAGQDGLTISGFQPFLTLKDTNAGNARTVLQAAGGDFAFYTNSTIGGSPAMVLRTTGFLGVNSPFPAHRLTIGGGPSWTANGWGGAVALSNAAAIAWSPNSSGKGFGIGQTNGGLYFFNSASAPGTGGSPANYLFKVSDAGNAMQMFSGFTGNGLVKAMLFVNAAGTIVGCYNGQEGFESTTPPCGFTVSRPAGFPGIYDVIFTFDVSHRYYTANVFNDASCLGGLTSFDIPNPGSVVLRVRTWCAAATDKPFMLFVL